MAPALASAVTTDCRKHVAVLIGIAHYENLPVLDSPIHDVQALAELLQTQHGYAVQTLCDQQATLRGLRRLLADLPGIAAQAKRLIVYFAGHGIAVDQEKDVEGGAGYLLPQDAQAGRRDTLLAMLELQDTIAQLSCPHLLLILDCCFAGAFRWSQTRNVVGQPEGGTLYRERYHVYTANPAWQVLCSAAYDEQALDVGRGPRLGSRGPGSTCSPFAMALCDGLSGKADVRVGGQHGDGVILASELLVFITDWFRRLQENGTAQQTPTLWSIAGKDKGQFVFELPGRTMDLPSVGELIEQNNPYAGLRPYDEAQQHLFFGREQASADLVKRVHEAPVTVVIGASGSGKSSLVYAGLIPALRKLTKPTWEVLPPLHPGLEPLAWLAQLAAALNPGAQQLAEAVAQWQQRVPQHSHLLLVIDQAEDLVTLPSVSHQAFFAQIHAARKTCPDRLHVVYTLRTDCESDFESLLKAQEGTSARFPVPRMTREELCQMIEGPAQARVLYFEPPSLVDELIDEVINEAGALPLLSSALSETYRAYVKGQRRDRSLSRGDYLAAGGTSAVLDKRAEEVYAAQDEVHKQALRNLMLRLVVPGQWTRRHLYKTELTFIIPTQAMCYRQVLASLDRARLIISDSDTNRGPYYSLTHDKLPMGWPRLRLFAEELPAQLPFYQSLAEEVSKRAQSEGSWLLWSLDPRLPDMLRALRRDPSYFTRPEVRFLGRSSLLRSLALALVIAVVVGLSSLTVFAFVERARAQTESRENYRRMLVSHVEQGRQYILSGQPDRALLWLARAYDEQSKLEAAAAGMGIGWRYLLRDAMRTVDAQRVVLMTSGPSRSIAFQPVAPFSIVVTTGSAVAWLYHQDETDAISLVGHRSEVIDGRFSGDGKTVITRDLDGQVKQWDPATGALLTSQTGSNQAGRTPLYDETVRARTLPPGIVCPAIAAELRSAEVVVWSKSRKLLLTAELQPTAHLWNVRRCEETTQLVGSKANVAAAAFHPNEQSVVVLNADQSGAVFDIMGGQYQRGLGASQSKPSLVAASPDGELLLLGSSDGSVRLMRTANGVLQTWLVGHRKQIEAASFRADGREVAIAAIDGMVRIWNVDGGDALSSFQGPQDIEKIQLSADGQRVVIKSTDEVNPFVAFLRDGHPDPIDSADETHIRAAANANPPDSRRILRTPTSRRLVGLAANDTPAADIFLPLLADQYGPFDAIWLADKQLGLVTWSWSDSSVRVWNTQRGLFQEVNLGFQHQPEKVLVSPDATHALVRGLRGEIQLWALVPARLIAMYFATDELNTGDDELNTGDFVFGPQSRRAMFSEPSGAICVIDAMTGQRLVTLPPTGRALEEMRFTTDESKIVTLYDSQTITIWDEHGKQLGRIVDREGPRHAALSPDGKVLYTFGETNVPGEPGTVRLWNSINGGGPIMRVSGRNAEYSPDGNVIATASPDGNIRLWDPITGKNVQAFGGLGIASNGGVPVGHFTPDSQQILSFGGNLAKIMVHDIRTGHLLADIAQDPTQRGGRWMPSYSPDGTRFLFVSEDPARAYVYDAKTYELLRTIGTASYPVASAQFSSDNSRIITLDQEGRVRLWAAEIEGRPAEAIRKRLRCRLPVRFEGDAIVPASLDAKGCAVSVLSDSLP